MAVSDRALALGSGRRGLLERLGVAERKHCALVLDAAEILALEVLVVAVLDLTDGAAKQGIHFADLGPLGPDDFELLEDELVLCTGPLPPHDVRIDHVVPALAALPAEAVGEVSGDDDPVLRAEHVDLLA